MHLISQKEAMRITGHRTLSGLRCWIDRYNKSNPGRLILRRPGAVDRESLEDAIRYISLPASLRTQEVAQ